MKVTAVISSMLLLPLNIPTVQADDGEECRKSYVTEYCTATMVVAMMKAKQGGREELVEQLRAAWDAASPIYKGSLQFDDESKAGIYKTSLDAFSLDNVAACIAKDKDAFRDIVAIATSYCDRR